MNLEKLIEQCKKNDVIAQKALYKQFAPILFGICLKYCKNKTIAEDLFQEAFITIFNKIVQFKHKGSFEGWAKRITVNTILQHFKKQRVYELVNEENIAIIEIEDNCDTELSHLSLDYLLESIQKLPDQYRLVFNLYVLDDYSHQEIAEALNISVGTSKSNLSRARALLKKEIGERPLIEKRY